MDKFVTDTLTNVADAVTAKDYLFEITINPENWFHALMQKIGLSPKKKVCTIRPIVTGNLIRISKLLLTIDKDALKDTTSFLDTSYRLMSDHGETLATVVAIAIQNDRHEPSQKLVDMIKNNLSMEEMFRLVAYVLDKMDHKNFLFTISSIRGLNVLENGEKKNGLSEVSPLIQGS